ncbi:AbrB/MazE/SpoVT family DNA-binding domain-containing protein [Candidatus Woesearchaeota archaeon]|nr:AbrB/MazE/SpoVT family DNA-binding domain-containing protein [Candidatus Woesearchaeota archaeon]
MKSVTRTRKIGGSIVVTVPKEIVKEEGIIEGELIEFEARKLKKSGFGLLKGMRPFTKEDKFKSDYD